LAHSCTRQATSEEIVVWEALRHGLPNRTEPRYHLAAAYRKNGDIIQEQKVWQEILHLSGESLWEAGCWDVEQLAGAEGEECMTLP